MLPCAGDTRSLPRRFGMKDGRSPGERVSSRDPLLGGAIVPNDEPECMRVRRFLLAPAGGKLREDASDGASSLINGSGGAASRTSEYGLLVSDS